MKKKYSPIKIVVALWFVFSIPYVAYTQYNYFKRFIADSSYQRGLTDAVSQLMKQAQKCEPIPVRLREESIQLVNLSCLTEVGADSDSVK